MERVLRRAKSEEEARKIFAQAEAALDAEQATPHGADARVTNDPDARRGVPQGQHGARRATRTIEQRVSRLNAHILPAIGDVPVTRWRVEHSRRVMEKSSKTLFSQRGREVLRGQLAAMRKLAWRLGWVDRSIGPPGRT
jgi:hypothetical protein